MSRSRELPHQTASLSKGTIMDRFGHVTLPFKWLPNWRLMDGRFVMELLYYCLRVGRIYSGRVCPTVASHDDQISSRRDMAACDHNWQQVVIANFKEETAWSVGRSARG